MSQSQFQFNDDQPIAGRRRTGGGSSLSGKLMAWGIAKNQTQANLILLCLATLCVGAIIFNLLSLADTPTPPPLVSTPATN